MKKWFTKTVAGIAIALALGMLAIVTPGGIADLVAQVNRVPGPGIRDITGALYANTEGQKNTYTWSFQNLTLAAAATDFAIIRGSATKTVKISRIVLDGIAASPQGSNIYLLKRSTAASGGSSVAATGVPMDSLFSAATGGVTRYHTSPTVGTLVGTIGAETLYFTSSGGKLTWTWGNRPAFMPTLRGIAQALTLNFGSATVPASATLNLTVETTEE